VKKKAMGRLREGADCVACMFALHYFFEKEAALNGFLRNVSDCLRIGGLFIGCCFDGKKVFDALRSVPEGGSLVGKEGDKEVWKLTKRYSATDLVNGPESFGLAIDVEFISIGTQQREYLMPFDLLQKKMGDIGCDLLTEEEQKDLQLQQSTSLFEKTYDMAIKAGQKYPMSPTIKQYSFFNRWFIFKRRRGGPLESVVEEEAKKEAGVPPIEKPVVPVAEAPRKKTLAEQAEEARKKFLEKREKPAASGLVAAAAAAAEEGKQQDVIHTLPVVSEGTKSYSLNELFLFYMDASKVDKLKLGEPDAARWLAPGAPFDILDGATSYPTLEHYLAAMKYKLATNKPELAESIYAQSGTIHQEFLRIRATESGGKALSVERDSDLRKAERKKVLDESSTAAMKKYRAIFDEGKWFSVKDGVLREGLRQRWERDAKLRRIVEAAKGKGLYLVYYTGAGTGSDLGGKRKENGTIDGENKVGKILMELAGYRFI